ncbi:MAG TPA: hypothetical protein VL443_18255 [Cyclobacteriaceae bacterium]|nr:hypothetical protein [Cyclobacteriaceae bacterium]
MKSWILLGILVIIKFPTLAQGSKAGYSPFQILVIHPDSVRIDELMIPFSDSIQKRYIDGYYASLKSYEKLKEDESSDEEIEKINAQIRSIKLREMEVYNFRYYYTMSRLILFDLGILFNPTYWEKDFSQKEKTLTGYAIEPSQLYSRDFDKLAKYYQVDYILTFENVHTEKLADTISSIALKFKAILYSSKKGKIVLKEDFSGNSQLNDYKYLTEIYSSHNKNERALEKSVDCDNYLNCLFRSATRFTTERLYEVISKIQKK